MLIAAAASLPFVLDTGSGQAPQRAQLSQVEQSPHCRDGQFHNQVPTPDYTGNEGMLAAWWEFLVTKRENARPAQPLPMVATDLVGLSPQQDTLAWLDHSSWYLQLASQRILIDPVLSNYAAPFSFLNRAFAGDYPRTAQTIPETDLLIISYDYYDHLDLATIKALMPKIKRVIAPLGVGSHLHYRGVRSKIIGERNWNQSVRVTGSLIVHMLPVRHFPRRGIRHNQTLWASFVFETPGQNVYCNGDSDYGSHFKAIDEQFGPVDLAIVGNGQCDQDWKFIRMMPEGTAQAAADLHAKAMPPGHAGHFILAKHTWGDPYKRLVLANRHRDYRLLTPMLGEPVILSESDQPSTAWWQQVTQ